MLVRGLVIYFYKLVSQLEHGSEKADAVDVEEPSLPRHRRRPRHYKTGDASPHFVATVEDHYRQIHSEVLDLAVSTVKKVLFS